MKRKSPTVTVLIPAVNEEKLITKIVKDCLKIKGYVTTVLVIIDSKTTDRTAAKAKKAGAKVLHIGKGKGKGTAIRKSIASLKTDYTVQIDADYQFQPFEIPLLLSPLEKGFDVTLGTRYQKGATIEKGSVTPLKRFGSYFLSLTTTLFTQQRITDVMAGFKGFKTPVLKKLSPKTDHFGYEAELVIKAAQYGYKIVNIPITYKARMEGRSNVESIKHGLLVLETIIVTGLIGK